MFDHVVYFRFRIPTFKIVIEFDTVSRDNSRDRARHFEDGKRNVGFRQRRHPFLRGFVFRFHDRTKS